MCKLDNIKRKIFPLLFFLAVLLFSLLLILFEHTQKTIKSRLLAIPLQEREYIENFYRFGFFVSSFGYTVFGDKPMSIETVDLSAGSKSVEGIDYMALEHILNRYRLKEGWEAWQKFEHLFPMKDYSVIHYPSPKLPGKFIEIAIINHKSFLSHVASFLDDFQSVLKNSYSPEEILQEYLKAKGSVFSAIRNHDGLFGTLLGYGRDNAWQYLTLPESEKMLPFSYLEPEDNQQIFLPLFASLPGKETAELHVKYEQQKKEIDVLFQDKDFLEKVLLKLTGESQLEANL